MTAACTANTPAGGPTYDSVRERLNDGPTRLFVGSESSSGTVTARRWTPDGWVEGTSTVTIEGGEVLAKVDANGQLMLDAFVVEVAPIDIPEEVFKKPAQLDDVRISLREPATGAATWTGDDDATATLTLALDLDWAIAVNGGKTPLGTQHMPPITVDFTLTGSGDHVGASISLSAMGELWNWAGLLEMTAVELSLSAETVD